MATIVMGDSLDSYNTYSELASSGRWLYAPSGTYGLGALIAGAGRYGGNAIKMQTISKTASIGWTYNNYYGASGYTSNDMFALNIPGYMTGNNTSNPMYGKAVHFAFWFKSVTTNSGAVSQVNLMYSCCTGTSTTVLYNGSALGLLPFLVYTPTSSPTAVGTISINHIGWSDAIATASCPVNLNDGNWHWVEVGITPYQPVSSANAGTGFWACVTVDQQKVINVTTGGATISNATNTATGAYCAFFLGYNPAVATVPQTGNDGQYYDDIVVGINSTFALYPLGPRRMACLRPNADGDTIGYVPYGSSDNYSAVNKGYSNTTSYVQSTGFNVEDRYKFPAMTYVPQNINAVITNIQAGNFEPGTAIGMSPVLYDGTTESVGARQALPQYKYNPYQTIYETDNSGNVWTTSEVNSIQVGFKSIQ
jgi:hypothetical protein